MFKGNICNIGTTFISKKSLKEHVTQVHGKKKAEASEVVAGATDIVKFEEVDSDTGVLCL
jgi:hypothetical protein